MISERFARNGEAADVTVDANLQESCFAKLADQRPAIAIDVLAGFFQVSSAPLLKLIRELADGGLEERPGEPVCHS